ncbi:MAG: glycoside hydrolase family 2, partial [Hymenobacter sp.]
TEEVFYDLCDEYGLLVWNDFWMSTEGYNIHPNDNQLFMDNARDVVRRFRNHASIALWCPRNEGYAPPALEDSLARLIATEDGTRHYQPQSRYLNLRTSGPWNYQWQPAKYFTDIAGGFSTELGTPAVPTAASMRKMMDAKDVWPIGDVWYYHDLHSGQTAYLRAIDSLYGTATSLEDFCSKAQLINYDSHRAMFESWNSKLFNNTTGLLLWMTHPAWPSTVWQVYSWDYETFGAYYGSLKSCEPVHIQMNLTDNKVVAVNTSLQNFSDIRGALTLYDSSGKILFQQAATSNLASNHQVVFFTPVLPQTLPDVYLARVMLTDAKDSLLSLNDYWKHSENTSDFYTLKGNKSPKIAIDKWKDDNGRIRFTITNTATVTAVSIKLNLAEKGTNKIVLPAYFSDGYFNLLPGESRVMTVDYNKKLYATVSLLAEAYNLPSQVIY